MDRVQPASGDGSPDDTLRCEDCGATRTDTEPGWVRVAYPVEDRRAPGDDVFLYYCPVHAAHFDLAHPGVVPAFEGA